MHLKVQKRNGREYLSIVQNYRDGGKTRTRTIETIGYADSFADRFDDPVAHFRAHVEEMNAQAAAEKQPVEFAFEHDDVIDGKATPRARLGAAIALGCLDAIGVRGFFEARAGREGFPAQAGRVFEMLAAERMMHVASKRESWTARDSFPRPCGFSFEDAYAALPCIARESGRLDAHLRRTWQRVNGRENPDTVLLVCGTYGFPTGGRGTRASVVVALDMQGIPLAYREIDGNLSPRTIRRSTDALKDLLGARRAIVIAGALQTITPAIAEIAAGGDGFVLFQPSLDETPGLEKWVSEEKGYRSMGAGARMKTRVAERQLPDGRDVKVKEVALRGGGYALRDGRAALVSSETDLGANAIVQLFREVWRQAEPFQPLEADFSPMPWPVGDRDHIRAHFAICYAAFFALRVLRWKSGWNHNAADTADALLRMEGVGLQRNYYLFNYRSDVTDDIERAVDVPPARRLRTRAELRSIPVAVKHALREPAS